MLRYLAGASPFELAARYQARSDRTRRREQIECAPPAKANLS
jgi:hypothetical protein